MDNTSSHPLTASATGSDSTCLVAVLRVVWLKQLYLSKDPTWDFVTMAHWSAVEVNIAIVCACLMTAKPLIANFFPRFLQPNGGYQQHDDDVDHPRTIGTSSFRQKTLHVSKPTDAYLADQSVGQSSTAVSDPDVRMEDWKGRGEDAGGGPDRLEKALQDKGQTLGSR